MPGIFRRSVAVALIAATFSVSARAGIKDAPPPPDRCYVLIGVAPANTELSLAVGSIREGRFRGPIVGFLDRQDTPADGFVLIDAKADRTMAVVKIELDSQGFWDATKKYVVCEDAPALIFATTGGKVVYLTSVKFDVGGNALVPRFHADIEAARAFLKAHYPSLAGSLEQGQPQFLPTDFDCNSF